MEQSYAQANKSGADVVGLRLLFRLTRSRIVGIRVEGLPEGVQATKKTIIDLTTEVRWDASLPEGAEVTATLEYEGEPLVLTDFIWITEGDQDNFSIPFAEPVDSVMEHHLTNNPLETVAETEDPVRVFEARRDVIEETTDPKVKEYQEFFWHYDWETHDKLIPHNRNIAPDEQQRRISIIRETSKVLCKRVLQRASIIASGRPLQHDELADVPDDSWVDYLSRLQLGVMRDYLPDSNRGINLAAVAEAFEMFANGELRVKPVHGILNSEPDSAHVFSFAEFAFLAIEKQIDVNEWGSLLSGLVMLQEIFCRTYKPPADLAPPYVYGDYVSTNFNAANQANADDKQALREEYAGKSLLELTQQAGKNASDAFPGNLPIDNEASGGHCN